MSFAKFLRDNRLKGYEVAQYLGLSEGSVSKWKHGKSEMNEDNLHKLLKNPFGWDTTALADESISVSAKGTGNSVSISYKSNQAPAKPEASATVAPDNTVPIIPLNAIAGTLNDYTEGVMPYQCEKILNPFASQATIAIKVNGESMMPKYPSGTLVFCRKVNEKAFIEYFHTYVLDTANGVVIKQIEPTDSDDTIKCVSLNTKYPPFELEKQYIYGWWKVVGCVMFE